MVMMMKISKCKKELARIISEHGGWRDGAESAAQCVGGEVSFRHDTATKRRGEDWCGGYLGACDDIRLTGVKLPNWHQTILSRAEYFHLYPAPDADGWIELDGKHEPEISTSGLTIWCKWSDGLEQSHEANMVDWVDDSGVRVVAYRLCKPEQSGATDKLSSEAVSAAKIALMSDSIEELVRKPEQSKPEFCESVMRSIPEPDEQVLTNPPTIEQLAADYRNLLDFARRKQQEADDAKADADAKMKSLELAGEALGLLVSLITAKQEPELATVQVGDEVECAESNIKRDKYNGMVGRLRTIDESDTSTPYLVDFGGEEKIWCHKVKFIRRP